MRSDAGSFTQDLVQQILTWAETMLMATLVRWSLAGTVAIPSIYPSM